MKNKQKFLYIALGVIVLIAIVGIKNSSFLQGKMFRFDNKKPLITNDVDVKNLSQQTRTDNGIETILNENKIKNDLKNIWGVSTRTKTEVFCPGKKGYDPNNDYDNNQHGVKIDINGIEVVFTVPNEVSLESDEVKGGIMLMKIFLPKVQEYFGPYPCDHLTISKFFGDKDSTGGPAKIRLFSAEFAYDPPAPVLNKYYLLFHELMHSYYYEKFPMWLQEGVPRTLPYNPGLKELSDLIDWELVDGEKLDYQKYYNKEARFEDNMKTWDIMIENDENAITYYNNLCELNDKGTEKFWGNTLLLDLMIKFGEKPVMDTLRIIYEKWLYTGETPKEQDFYDAFLYYVSQNNKSAVDQYSKAKTLLKTKLCL